MTDKTLSPDALRFLRTLRVATSTALAAYVAAHMAPTRPGTSFLALAAKGRDDWRFPTDGLVAADGLLRATLAGEGPEGRSLALQAFGAAGLTRYAGRSILVKTASGRRIAAAFDADGAMRLPLAAHDLDEAELAGFDIETTSDAP